jgi:hypothetical protein
LEGHAIAMSDVTRLAKTMQVAWVVPITVEAGRCTKGREELLASIDEIRSLTHKRLLFKQNSVRLQYCDIKLVPQGRAILSSSPAGVGVMVTATIESTLNYSWIFGGKNGPRTVLESLTNTFAARGLRLHLGKNVFIGQQQLKVMYGDALHRFAKVKRELDPTQVWGSEFWKQLSKAL